MTLACTECDSRDLRITDQSYTKDSAVERYECGDCGATGTLRMTGHPGGTESRCTGSITSRGF